MIKIKEKRCKGTGEASGYGCGNNSKFRKYGLCKDGNRCYQSFLLNSSAGKKILHKNTLPKIKKVENRLKAPHRKDKSISILILEARKPFQQWIRMRDNLLPCISCGKTSEFYDGGHFKKAESFTGLIFDERNCRKQCMHCNRYLDGNIEEYRKRLLEMFGPDWITKLEEDANRLRLYKWTREELLEIKNKYTLRIKNLNNK